MAGEINSKQYFRLFPPVCLLKAIYHHCLSLSILMILDADCTVHYGKQGGHFPHVLHRPCLVFLIAPEAFLQGIWVKYMTRTLSTWSKRPKMSTKLLILAFQMNVRLVTLIFPECSVHPVAQILS